MFLYFETKKNPGGMVSTGNDRTKLITLPLLE